MKQDTNDTEETTKDANTAVASRNKLSFNKRQIGWFLFGVMLIISIFGIIAAMTADVRDPTKIKMQPQIILQQPEPAASPVKTPSDEALSIQLPESSSSSVDEVTPFVDQQESTIDLIPEQSTIPVQPEDNPKSPPLVPEEQLAPQSMIHWDKEIHVIDNKRPRIVIVIDDMGLNSSNSRRVVEIDAPLTLAYMPYASQLEKQTTIAKAKGHELIVHMPMEPINLAQNNPGPNALLTHNTSDENLKRLKKNLDSFEGYIGLNNHMGSAMTSDFDAMRPVMQEIKKRGLWFLDSRTAANSVAGDLAKQLDIPYVSRDIFLDNTPEVSAIVSQLNQAKKIARERGYAVTIGHPYESTILALKKWIPQAEANGIDIVPLSSVISDRFPQAVLPKDQTKAVELKSKDYVSIEHVN